MAKKYYADCTNPECDVYHKVLDIGKPCPECGSKLEPAQVEDWNK